ncbi:MgtC/SapB family protein [Kribbella sp. NPDC051770]|uniref:MgtC/SapB family protein n=1 Tax=Kribbella sp. NPDC051770 TaxID=3155413 RepID=UPI00342EA359
MPMQWAQQLGLLAGLALAVVLGAAVGTERQFRSSNSGIRTHSLVALGAAVFTASGTLVGAAGSSLDPSRIAAQVASGVGFLGAGLIFVRRDTVRGLTTAASLWLSAAIGVAAGANLILIAVAATACHFFVVLVLPHVPRLVLRRRYFSATVTIRYPDGHGVLRGVLAALTTEGWTIDNFDMRHDETRHTVHATLHVHGQGTRADLIDRVEALDGVTTIELGDTHAPA